MKLINIGRITIKLFVTLLLLQLCALSHSTYADERLAFIGQVFDVVSGDQLRMRLPDGRELDVHLAGIVAPVQGQYYADQSRAWLNSQLNRQIVSADCMQYPDKAFFNCLVFPDDREINLVSLYHGFSKRDIEGSVIVRVRVYQSAEREAKKNHSGLWAQ